MNAEILNIEIQEFITSNLKFDVSTLLLNGISFNLVDAKAIIEQIESKKRCEIKLPTWFKTRKIYYPNKLNIEQTSSEITAKYKASLISGKSLIDLTGGFGVDAFYFSKHVENITHCEISTELSKIVSHNYKVLNVPNITCINTNGINVIKELNKTFDWIYIDPSRRDDHKQKVFLLSDCTPNIILNQELFFNYANNVMIKTSPLLDLSATLKDLKFVKEIHIVASNNEVKELLWIIDRSYNDEVLVKTINILKNKRQRFNFKLDHEQNAHVKYNEPLTYLYEPNSAILKSGAFKILSDSLHIFKMHKHSHLYTSNQLINFPGRIFKIEKQLTFNKKEFAKEKIIKANVTTRNFPLSVESIRRKFKIKDGGEIYLFFTTNLNEEKVILVCSKIEK